MNHGVIIKKRNTDYIAGQETAIVFKEIKDDGNWFECLPKNEPQSFGFDTMSCVTFSALNLIETQVNFLVSAGLISTENIKKLTDWGFFENGKFNCSDRFTAKMSGTTKSGNTLQAVWDSIRKDGLVPESTWPATGIKDWDGWNSEIPQQVKDFAKNILTCLDFKYEWIITGNCGKPDKAKIKEALKQCPLQIAAPCCPKDDKEIYRPCGSCVTQHATEIYNATDDFYFQFDSYDKYIKTLSNDYPMPYILKGVVIEKTLAPAPVISPIDHSFNKDLNYGDRSKEVSWLQKALIFQGYKTFDTGYYGVLTAQAVSDFQWKYKVANPITLLWNRGRYFGPATRTKMNEIILKADK
jgi:hypothetical protein